MLDNKQKPQDTNQTLMLQIQIEELTAMLVKEKELHAKASARATSAERRNASFRNQIEKMESDLSILAQCWGCGNLGKEDMCKGCTNNAVFIKEGNEYQWRGKH